MCTSSTFDRFSERRDRTRHLMADLRMAVGVGRGEVCVLYYLLLVAIWVELYVCTVVWCGVVCGVWWCGVL